MESIPTAGLHHVTAICGDAQRAVDFYVRLLGLRFLKRTVNFDDPSTYHLYFGDYVGHPGTALTFFAWRDLPEGLPGAGQAVRLAFKVPEGSLDSWTARLESGAWAERFPDWDAELSEPEERFGRRSVRFRDPDGLGLALVEREEVDPELQWTDGSGGTDETNGTDGTDGPVPPPMPPGMAIAGFHGVILAQTELEPTAEVLVDVLGLERADQEDEDVLFVARAGAGDGNGALGPRDTVVEVEAAPSSAAGRVARGSIHHVAYRAADEEHQKALRSRARSAGLGPTPVIDRFYFRSVYFREPGGALFEVATDEPGFTRDQAPEDLGGRDLTLPPWLEARREMIESHLVPVEPPDLAEAEGDELARAGERSEAAAGGAEGRG